MSLIFKYLRYSANFLWHNNLYVFWLHWKLNFKLFLMSNFYLFKMLSSFQSFILKRNEFYMTMHALHLCYSI